LTEQEPASVPELSIVMPVYNEGDAVEPVLRALDAAVKTSREIVVVWDFDEDTTRPVVERLADEIAGLRGIRNDLGRGVLNAMKAGIADAHGDYVLISMADGSDEPHLVDGMLVLARNGADVVAASRYMRGGRQVGGPPLKRLMSRTAGLTLHWFGGVATHDATNNFKLYARRFLDATTIESQGGFELAIELTVKATLAGRRVAELPTTWRDRTAGASNFKLRAWLPRYLRWYLVALRGRLAGLLNIDGGSPNARAAAKVLPLALTASIVTFALVVAGLRWSALSERGLVGTDFSFYKVVAERYVQTGSQYLALQLSGPYESQPLVPYDVLPSLYPPPALFLFVPFVVLPAALWWAIPLGVIGFALWRWRPARWTWPLLALCLAWPETTTSVMVGNSTMWAVAFIGAGLLAGWPAAALVFKPSFLPFALVGVRRRSFWIAVAAIVLASLPLFAEWQRWFSVLANGSAAVGYSIGSYPAALIPILSWLGRADRRQGPASE